MQPIIRNAIARIDVMQQGRSISRGTGFLIADGLVLTALHVVADRTREALTPYAGEIAVNFPNSSMKAAIYESYWDRLADWALLRCETTQGLDGAPRPLPIAELREDGATWQTYGFPDANPRDGMVNIGEVSNRQGTLEGNSVFQLFCREAAAGQGAPVKGLSGSPVIVRNAVVGLLRFALMKDAQTVAGTVYACPIASVLEKAGKLLPLPDPCFGLPGLARQPFPAEPFKHLAWFTEKEAEIFFGRNRDIRQMYERLTSDDAPPIVLLYGQAGVGKSSFLDAGLVPRLRWYHQVCYLRRDVRSTLLKTLRDALNLLGGEPAESGDSLGAAWIEVEQNGAKPLVVFFDQIEELYTHANPQCPHELEEFAKEIGKLFAGSTPPRGRLVLSFRKEWFPEVQKQMELNSLSYGKVFLEGLDRAAVLEAITGLTETERLRQYYSLKIEAGLADIIANDILADRDSPIAPTLQILLTKMWRKATALSRSAPAMTLEQYRNLKQEGVLLGDFLDQQLEALKSHQAEWVDSGLALDVLAFHTTPLLTAKDRTGEELLAAYPHRASDIPALLQELQSLFLLSDTSADSERHATRLCHDTLAPLVRERFAKSDHPGQRARRVLESRVEDWTEGNQVGLLDQGALGTVEQGTRGMRAINDKERKLIEASRIEQQRRERTHRVLQGLGVGAVILIAAFAVYALVQRHNAAEQEQVAKMQLALYDSARVIDEDPAKALILAVAAVRRAVQHAAVGFKNGQLDPKIQAALNQALNASLEETYIGSPAFAVAWSPENVLALAQPPDDTTLTMQLWDGTGKQMLKKIPTKVEHRDWGTVHMAFSPDGKVLALGMGNVGLWDLQGHPLGDPFGPKNVLSFAFAPDGKSILTGSEDGYLRSWSLTGHLQWERYALASDKGAGATKKTPEVGAVAVAKTPQGKVVIATGGSDDAVRFWSDNGTPLGAPVQEHGDTLSAVAMQYRPDDSARIITGGSDGAVVLMDGDHKPLSKMKYESAVCGLAFNPQGTVAAVALQGDSSGASVLILDADTGVKLFPDFRTTGRLCNPIAYDSSGSRLAVGDGTRAHLLNLEKANLARTIMVSPGERFDSVNWSPKGDRIAASAGGSLWMVDPRTGAVRQINQPPIANLQGPRTLTALTFNANGTSLAAAVSYGGVLRVWDANGNVSQEFRPQAPSDPGPLGEIKRLAFAGDGHSLMSAAADGKVTVWDLQGHGSRTLTLDSRAPADLLNDASGAAWPVVAFSRDGNTIAESSRGNVRLWNLEGGSHEPSRELNLEVNQDAHLGMTFSADGKSLFVWTSGGMLRWHLDSGKLVTKMPVLLGSAPSLDLALSPDHKTVFVPDARNIGVWSTVTGEHFTDFIGNPAGVITVDSSPDGSTLASGGDDGAIRLWRATWQQWLKAACEQLSSHPDFANPLPATGRQSPGVRASKLLKVSVSFDDENTQLAREACQERIWETKEL